MTEIAAISAHKHACHRLFRVTTRVWVVPTNTNVRVLFPGADPPKTCAHVCASPEI